MESFECHEAAEIFPMMEGQEFLDLVEDVKRNGLLEPIDVFEDKILDGRNRAKACAMAGVEAVFRTVQTTDPVAYVLSRNLHRRQLDTSQRAMIAAKARDYYDKQAKERQKDHGGTAPGKPKENTCGNVASSDRGPQSRDQAGKAVGVGGRTVDKAKKVQKQGVPELVKAVESGKLDVTKAAKIAELPKDVQGTILEDAKRQGWSGRQMVEEAKRLSPGLANGPVRMANGLQYARMAILQLEKIDRADIERRAALDLVLRWIGEQE